MKKYGKAGLLIVTLVIPALIFTFLRFFATNHYNVPFYHPMRDAQGKIEVVNTDTVFYTVPDNNGIELGKGLTVISYQAEQCDDSCQIMRDNLNRIYGLREGLKNLSLLSVVDSTARIDSVGKVGWQVLRMDEEGRKQILKWDEITDFKKSGSWKYRWLLVDENGHIRGYYNGVDREETDRLMAEIKILSIEDKAR